jgi:hypothetical protein
MISVNIAPGVLRRNLRVRETPLGALPAKRATARSEFSNFISLTIRHGWSEPGT